MGAVRDLLHFQHTGDCNVPLDAHNLQVVALQMMLSQQLESHHLPATLRLEA